MYHFKYTEAIEDSPLEGRAREYETMTRAIEMMREADKTGTQSIQSAAVVYKMRMLWSALIENAAHPDCELPIKLRAQIISIGLWAIGELEDIRSGKTTSFQGLIDITETIAEGLR